MAHTLAAALNLGTPPGDEAQLWEIRFSAELGSIPHLSRQEQRVGFGGFKAEDLNKSPVFGRGRLHLGLPLATELEFSWTPPFEINGGKPEGIYGMAASGSLSQSDGWELGWRLFAVRGEAGGDITCSREVSAADPGSQENPFGCRGASNDRITLDHEGLELTGSRLIGGGHWRPYLGYSYSRIHPHVQVRATVFETLDRSQLEADGNLHTFTLGTLFHLNSSWSMHAALSFTPLEIRRPPRLNGRDQDFWSLRLGVLWKPGWSILR
ncbi:MAG: hypothetical protein R3F41_10160 [Gammaproteobacteria bacterium]|nr:hypothetical protein [Pseudomonadales bacterium]